MSDCRTRKGANLVEQVATVNRESHGLLDKPSASAVQTVVGVSTGYFLFVKIKKLEHTRDMWVAAIAGKIGEKQPNGFIQAFERKPKQPKEQKQAEAVAAK